MQVPLIWNTTSNVLGFLYENTVYISAKEVWSLTEDTLGRKALNKLCHFTSVEV